MTPGQRWSAMLVLLLVLSLLAWAKPSATPFVPAQGAGSPPPAGAVAPSLLASEPQPAAAQPSRPGPPPLASIGELSMLLVPGSSPALAAPPSVVLREPRIVALVHTGDSAVPGRDDAAIARVFLSRGGFGVTILALPPSPDPAFCNKVAASGAIALSSIDVGATTRACLLAAPVALLSFDAMGDQPPGRAGDLAQVLSTRRGLADTIVHLARWGTASGALKGKVGIRSSTDVQSTVAGVVSRLRKLGVHVVATRYLHPGADGVSEIPGGVQAFAAAGVEVVVFALPVDQQRQWVAHQSVVSPSMRYVVSDAFDGVVNETYPVTFDGALAYTSLRVPWFARAHGETPAQAACRSQWEAASTPMTTLGTDEQIKVFAWCQHVVMTAGALGLAQRGVPFFKALRSERVASPLTSDLGPLGDGGFGPTKDAVVVWRASCTCWQEERPFTYG